MWTDNPDQTEERIAMGGQIMSEISAYKVYSESPNTQILQTIKHIYTHIDEIKSHTEIDLWIELHKQTTAHFMRESKVVSFFF